MASGPDYAPAKGPELLKLLEQLCSLAELPSNFLERKLYDYCYRDEDSVYYPVMDKDSISYTHGFARFFTAGDRDLPGDFLATLYADFSDVLMFATERWGEPDVEGTIYSWGLPMRRFYIGDVSEESQTLTSLWFEPTPQTHTESLGS